MAEVESVCPPLAARISAQPSPTAFYGPVAELIAAIHGASSAFAALLAERDARRRTAHLDDYESRSRAVRLLVGSRPRPACPDLDAADLAGGDWVRVAVEDVRPVSGPLAAFLGDAQLPNAAGRGSGLSLSERVVSELRGIDLAALDVERLLDRADRTRCESTDQPAPVEVDPVAEELRALGVTL